MSWSRSGRKESDLSDLDWLTMSQCGLCPVLKNLIGLASVLFATTQVYSLFEVRSSWSKCHFPKNTIFRGLEWRLPCSLKPYIFWKLGSSRWLYGAVRVQICRDNIMSCHWHDIMLFSGKSGFQNLAQFKATNGGPQWYSDTIMQTLFYLGTSWYFNT